ncbi:hypothetical protein T4B_3194 [Trichinella pseudospiralis]|uniref:Uncharacterized protein n=1 Tax=Trichinella pseudospiralis TaxID=6337 RepID=A0A0V1IDP1_TRIPS|nr:hypothetical protein T4A_5369 [Trichinella pseudospiralis]KRZ20941.1 hypothetical protein T4B_3194 [Trichinella pseudospiralis]
MAKHLCSKEDRINVFINYARLEHAIQVKDSCPTLLSQLLSSCQVGSFAPVTVWCFCHKRTIWLTGCVEGQLQFQGRNLLQTLQGASLSNNYNSAKNINVVPFLQTLTKSPITARLQQVKKNMVKSKDF